MKHLFVYGSLMFDEIWQQVVRGDYAKAEGRLDGFVRQQVQDEDYPGLIPGDGTVEGIIRLDVNDEDTVRLDTFEGTMYSRRAATATNPYGERIPVEVYVTRDDYHHKLTGEPWDPVLFQSTTMPRFMDRYFGFRSIRDPSDG